MGEKISEVIEFGRVLDIYPDYGCTQIRVKGERTGIEYLSCICHLKGDCPTIYGRVVIERGPKCEGRTTHVFSTEGLLNVNVAELVLLADAIAQQPLSKAS